MSKFISLYRFCWPYLKEYRGRLALGILFSLLFGIFNASFVWGSKALFARMEAPTEQHTIATTAKVDDGLGNGAIKQLDGLVDPFCHARERS